MSMQCKARLEINSNGNEEIRRFNIDEQVATSIEYLKNKIISIFSDLTEDKFKMFWKDSDGELIQFSSDEELLVALSLKQNDLFSIIIKKIDTGGQQNEFDTSGQYSNPNTRKRNQTSTNNDDVKQKQKGETFTYGTEFQNPLEYFSGSMRNSHYMGQHEFPRFPSPVTLPRHHPMETPYNFMHQSIGSQRNPTDFHRFSFGDANFGLYRYRDPYGSFSSSWNASGGNNQNRQYQTQQQSQTEDPNSTKN